MRVLNSISARLLVVTVIVVMVVEVAIFVPSIANFRHQFLQERLVRAELAALTVMTAPGGRPESEASELLLETADALSVAVRMDGRRILVLAHDMPGMPVAGFDLSDDGPLTLVVDAIRCLTFTRAGDVHLISGTTRSELYPVVEFTFPADTLKEAMLDYGLRILNLSLIISAITAGVVFFAVRRFVVSPLFDVVRGVEHFHACPDDPERVLRPSGGRGEVADAERAIAAMQTEVLRALSERRRLAALGEAVAKINHDLRNMLAAGQLMTERLGRSEDPMVARVLPKLVNAIDRASTLCTRTLDYGRAEETGPEITTVRLAPLVEEVVEGLGLTGPAAGGTTRGATGGATGGAAGAAAMSGPEGSDTGAGRTA
ncbi:MAG: histidine kinase dimerization/phospho-acceptor domain-containing protein, partial [Pseudomonadota bacterium]